jgi:hypothetical protein
MRTVVFLTGGRGKVGSYLKNSLQQTGIDVRFLDHKDSYSKYILPEESVTSCYDRVIILHSGQPSAPRSRLERKRYLSSSSELIKSSKIRGYEFLFISSLSAHQYNRSNYSQEKLFLEKLTKQNGGAVVKFGLITDIEESLIKKVDKIEKLLSFFGVGYLVGTTKLYFTGTKDLDLFVRDLSDVAHSSLLQSYFELHVGNNSDLGLIRTFIKSSFSYVLWVFSSLGSGRSDALLSLIDGMQAGEK